MPGLWNLYTRPDTGYEEASCAILTRPAAPAIARIHDRMPVILSPKIWRQRLSRAVTDPDTAKDMLAANALEDMRAYPVSRRANTPK